MGTTKYAVFTMDVEVFGDTDCVYNSGAKVDIDALDGLDEYMNILDRHGIKSTLFTVGKLAPKIADRLKEYIAKGHNLALHGYKHVAPMNMSVDKFREHLTKAKQKLREIFDIDVKGFRAPCFSMDNARLNVLRELNFTYDSSHLGFTKARHTVDLSMDEFTELRDGVFHNDGFFEFGLTKGKIFGLPFPISGGGYVRLANWPFIKSVIRNHIKNNDYYVFYLHPFELTHQKIPFISNLKTYDKYYLKAGINSYGKHIEEIIQMLKEYNYRFVTFEQLAEIMSVNT